MRHGAHSLLGHVLAGRMPGVALSPQGQAEAGRIAQALAARPIAAVFASPLQRAQETAAPIAAAHGLPVLTEPGLDEVDFGAWTGLAFTALDGAPGWHVFNAFRSMAPVPEGETMLAAQARAVAAILGLRAAWPGAELVAVSHGDIIKAILAHVLAVPLDLFRRIEISPGSRSVVALGEEDVQVEAVNLPPGA